MPALGQVKECIRNNKNFVLQGGAGSGKTETLKQVLEFISQTYPEKKIACITHTNLAVAEIISRVGNQYTICTIHSFLNALINDYKKNIHKVIFELFKIERVIRKDIGEYANETEQKKEEYENYKEIYKKYASRLFAVKGKRAPKVEGKKVYDATPEVFNNTLNTNVELLNEAMRLEIEGQDFNKVHYNETPFNDYKELGYGHDGLLEVAHLLFSKYKILGKIVQDKFDCIFIDEYQDTNEKIINIFLKLLPEGNKTLVGLFGDSMQAIYEDGIGNVESYINDNTLTKINKEDNYRCSAQVVTFINKLRNDGLTQTVAFKKKHNGELETIEDRQGSASLYYYICESKPHVRSSREEKDAYIKSINALVKKATQGEPFRHLKLSNKSIASDVGFEALYEIFSDRFLDPHDYIEKHFGRLQLLELIDLCRAYESKNYNYVLSALKKSGFSIKSIKDKKEIQAKIDSIISSDKSIIKSLEKAFDLQLLRKSEAHTSYLEEKEAFLASLDDVKDYAIFKAAYLSGKNTAIRIKEVLPTLEEGDFEELEYSFRRENFYTRLFSDEITYAQAKKYIDYINEETSFITMHKTKGSGIPNVLVVLDEYFWNAYDFKTVFQAAPDDERKKEKNQKLVYVACSRAISNLKCVKMILREEEEDIKRLFDHSIKVDTLD